MEAELDDIACKKTESSVGSLEKLKEFVMLVLERLERIFIITIQK